MAAEDNAAVEAGIVVPERFREMPRWWNDPDERAWLTGLPRIVADQCRAWDLQVDGEPMHGSNALVVPVSRHGTDYVLRLAPPGDDVAEEAAALRFWDGHGTVRLFDIDLATRAMLLERLDADRPLAKVALPTAVEVIAKLINDLAVPVPTGPKSTAEIAREHADEFAADWTRLGGPTPRRQLDLAIDLATEAANRPGSNLAVDGDLHCEQVLTGRDGRWVVVDPVLLCGDPEYDFARVLWDRLEELPVDTDVTAVFDRFVRAADLPADRARAWVVLRSMSYLLWGIPRGLTVDPPRCQRLLDIFC